MDMATLATRLGGAKVARWMTRRSPRVLMYHRFGPTDGPRHVGVETFERQMRTLRTECHVLGLSTLVRLLDRGGALPEHPAVVTIDDGYRDFYTFALPVLRRYAIPATLYVATEFVDGRRWLWPDTIRFVLERTRTRSVAWSFDGQERRYDLDQPGGVEAAWNDLAERCLLLSDGDKDRLIADLARELDVSLPERPVEGFDAITWAEAREIQTAGIEIGSHSATHPRLPAVPRERLAYEIQGSKAAIESHLGRQVRSFCYPQGRPIDYSGNIKGVVREAGYESATVGHHEPEEAFDPFEIRRYPISRNMRHFWHVIVGFDLLGRKAAALRPGRRRSA